MATSDIAVLRIVGRYQDQNIVNTMHYIIDELAGNEVDQWKELVDDWETEFATEWLGRHIDSFEFVGLKAFTVRGGNVPPGFASVRLNGTVVGDPQESFVCRTITLYGDGSNSRRRGRLMLSGGAETMFDDGDGSLTGAEIGFLNALGENLIEPLNVGNNTYKPILYDKLLDTVTGLVSAKGRITPSIIRSRRIKQFLIG